ncbi:MAG: hypothetical protein M1819_005416 [Sarea resinae]|nr:MAG: hypothetical protein M1819_005416 [Sarea resinae]
MWSLTATLTYLKLKCLATLVRVYYRLFETGPPATMHYDSILNIPSRDAGRTIKTHVYESTLPHSGPRPVLINLHSSGFVLPLHGTGDAFSHHIATHTPYTVLDASYRLSPEYPFPAALNDSTDVINHVLSQPDRYDTTRISVSGFSAGGTLALVAALLTFPKDTFRSILAYYPPTKQSQDHGSKAAPDPSGHPIPGPIGRIFTASYCFHPVAPYDPADPRISPYFAPLANLPARILFVTCACDSLAPETEELAQRAQAEAGPGIRVVSRRMPGCDHSWDISPNLGPLQRKARDDAYALAVAMLNEQEVE